jgi:hypothetical protein
MILGVILVLSSLGYSAWVIGNNASGVGVLDDWTLGFSGTAGLVGLALIKGDSE